MAGSQGFPAAVLLMLLCGCAAQQPRAAMVAAGGPSDYGYSEQRLSAESYRITYRSPVLTVPADEAARSRKLEAEKARARDLALWRATQIAAAGSYGYLKVESEHRDATVQVERGYAPVPAGIDSFYAPDGALSPPYWFYDWPRSMAPFTYYPDPFATEQARVRVTARVSATLTVALSKVAGPDYRDAVGLGRDLAARCAGSTYP